MDARQLPSQRGFAWLSEGFKLWRRNPALLTFVSFGYLLTLLLVSIVPFIGQPIASLLMPVLSLGVLNTCLAIDKGRKAGPDVLFSGFQQNLPALVMIGAIYLVASVLVLGITIVADGGTLLSMMTTGAKIDPEATGSTGFTIALLVAIALSTPVMMAYWFAPVLAGWWEIPAPKAMFFSFIACQRNWRPFLMYSIALAIFAAVLPSMVLALVGRLSPVLATILSVPLPLVVIPIVFASFYVNACDVFGPPRDASAGD
ncbi:BPSS1780 family membrane protein [Azoarcus sp. KH32C]|uniref:BPSS1780 family membrane protein n=1 Tax=Azoarcus sp. KH32C TaxID=748247 RepID=UPI0002385FA2|nr:BPSS1780 family membrane protein [Azoarcus sp. KH32C]BAL22931.1 putative transmembrane protein [Azoarcus sp. KH32C]